jgi:hypothetical protein
MREIFGKKLQKFGMKVAAPGKNKNEFLEGILGMTR